MINNSPFKFLKLFSLFILITILSSCKKESTLDFTEVEIINESDTTIEINIPKAKGKSGAAKQINASLTQFINNALNIDGVSSKEKDIKESITDFKKAYSNFKTQIGKTLYSEIPAWEVLVDGEITYRSETLVCIAMTSTINTGGAHSNLVFRFFTFDAKTGRQLETKDLINDVTAFTSIVKKYYDKELLSARESRINAFETDTFKLPKHLGFSEEGVVVFYNTFNTGNNNVIEFIIPYVTANEYLNF